MILHLKRIIAGYIFKGFCIISVTITIAIIFVLSLRYQRTADQIPSFSVINLEQQEHRSPFFVKVKTGLYIKNFYKFDVFKNDFIMDAVVWFEFPDGEISLDNISKFSFIDGDILQKSLPDIRLINKNVFVKYELKVAFYNDLKFNFFPYEYHRLSIVITNNYMSTEGLVYETKPDNFILAPNISLSNWKLGNQITNYGYRLVQFEINNLKKTMSYPLAIFTVDFQSIGIQNILIIFIPILFILLLSLFSLFVPFAYGTNNFVGMTFAIAAITSILGYRFVIESIIPAVGYMTVADSVYLLVLFVTFIPFILQVVAAFLVTVKQVGLTQEEGVVLAEKLNSYFLLFFLILSFCVIGSLYKLLIF